MFHRRPANFSANLHPIPHRRDFTEGNSDLRHAERSGVHAQKNHALAAAAKPAQIIFVRRPGVSERIVDVRDRRHEFQSFNLPGKFPRGGDQVFAGAGDCWFQAQPRYFNPAKTQTALWRRLIFIVKQRC
jgi:hypothetical protein